MIEIPQRELRNQVSAILKRAEAGERFTITVSGRPVAELGPLASGRAPVAPDRLAAILAATPVDPGWAEELQAMRDEDRHVSVDIWRV